MTVLETIFIRHTRADSAVPAPFVRLAVLHARHIGAALGVICAKRRIRLRIVQYSQRGTATSASWNVMYRAWLIRDIQPRTKLLIK